MDDSRIVLLKLTQFGQMELSVVAEELFKNLVDPKVTESLSIFNPLLIRYILLCVCFAVFNQGLKLFVSCNNFIFICQ